MLRKDDVNVRQCLENVQFRETLRGLPSPKEKRLLKISLHLLFRIPTSLDRKGHLNLKIPPLFQVFYYIGGETFQHVKRM